MSPGPLIELWILLRSLVSAWLESCTVLEEYTAKVSCLSCPMAYSSYLQKMPVARDWQFKYGRLLLEMFASWENKILYESTLRYQDSFIKL